MPGLDAIKVKLNVSIYPYKYPVVTQMFVPNLEALLASRPQVKVLQVKTKTDTVDHCWTENRLWFWVLLAEVRFITDKLENSTV